MNETPAQPRKPNILVRLLALLVTVALVMGAVALVAYRDELNMDALKRWLAYRTVTTGETGQGEPFTHAGGSKLSLACLDTGAALVSRSGAHYYSLSGEVYAGEVEVLDSPVLDASATTAVAYDAGGQSLFLFRGREEPFSLHLEGGGDLLSARVNDAGWLAVTAQQSGYKGAVTVYNDKYHKVIEINLSSTFVVDAAVSPDCRTVAIVTMGQEAGAFQSKLLIYPVDSKEPSATYALGDMTVLDLDYESGRIWVLGENRTTVVDLGTQALAQWSFGQNYLKGASLGGDGFATILLGRYRAGAAETLVTLGPDGAPLATQALRGQVLDLDCAGRYVGVLSGDRFDIYTSSLAPYASLADTQNARTVSLTANASALLADSQQAWLYLPTPLP